MKNIKKLLERFKNIVITYDNDTPGRDGALKVAREINFKFPDSRIKIFNWRAKPFSPKFISYDQTNVYLNYSETNLEDDSILIEDEGIIDRYREHIPKSIVRNNEKLNKAENLPESYVNLSEELNQNCKNSSIGEIDIASFGMLE